MKKKSEIIEPKNQVHLYGYKFFFNAFIKLFDEGKLPNSLLLSGQKGIGKSTFAYHFINNLFSKNEKFQYSVNDFFINSENSSFKLVNSNTHPNFFLIDNLNTDNEIKIDKVRSLLKFLNKTTYNKNLKIVLIDDAEHLNINSSNALLKAIEEPPKNTYFLIINNSASTLSKTLKSRCVEFKIFLSKEEKKVITKNILNQYQIDINSNNLISNLYFDTPGNLTKLYLTLKSESFDISTDKLSCIVFLIDKYSNEKNPEVLNFITLLINLFYNEISMSSNENISSYFLNQSRIIKKINEMRKFNLNEKNVLFWVKDILLNEKK